MRNNVAMLGHARGTNEPKLLRILRNILTGNGFPVIGNLRNAPNLFTYSLTGISIFDMPHTKPKRYEQMEPIAQMIKETR